MVLAVVLKVWLLVPNVFYISQAKHGTFVVQFLDNEDN